MRRIRFLARTIRIMKIGGKMKRVQCLLFTICFLILSGLFYGCGGGPGVPGSHGTEDTGVILEATLEPAYLGKNTSSVDAIQDLCDAGPPQKFEVFTDHTAAVIIRVRLVNPNATFQPGNLYIEKYTVEYRRSSDSIGAPPIQSDTRFKTIVLDPLTGTAVNVLSDTVTFVDLLRKDQYRADVMSGRYSSGSAFLNNYTAIYTFEGKNEFGSRFSFKAQTDFQIGDFNNCGGQ
jgi:hypothetical protein